jgi:hypothetical protein
MDDAALGERYGGVLALPLTYLIDRNGRVRMRFQGETDENTIEMKLKLVLDQRRDMGAQQISAGPPIG